MPPVWKITIFSLPLRDEYLFRNINEQQMHAVEHDALLGRFT